MANSLLIIASSVLLPDAILPSRAMRKGAARPPPAIASDRQRLGDGAHMRPVGPARTPIAAACRAGPRWRASRSDLLSMMSANEKCQSRNLARKLQSCRATAKTIMDAVQMQGPAPGGGQGGGTPRLRVGRGPGLADLDLARIGFQVVFNLNDHWHQIL